MTHHQRLVDGFMQAIGEQRPPKQDFQGFDGAHRLDLLDEELEELHDAWEERDFAGVVDALCDLLYVTYGSAVALGIDLEPYFLEVHATNMAKRHLDGGFHFEDGRLVKPPGWKPPALGAMLLRNSKAPYPPEEDRSTAVSRLERLLEQVERSRDIAVMRAQAAEEQAAQLEAELRALEPLGGVPPGTKKGMKP